MDLDQLASNAAFVEQHGLGLHCLLQSICPNI